jgi:hypothetical protein
MTNGTSTPGTNIPIILVPQTGMPTLHTSRSRELNYDVLQYNIRFVRNPYGPQMLPLSRPVHRWGG